MDGTNVNSHLWLVQFSLLLWLILLLAWLIQLLLFFFFFFLAIPAAYGCFQAKGLCLSHCCNLYHSCSNQFRNPLCHRGNSVCSFLFNISLFYLYSCSSISEERNWPAPLSKNQVDFCGSCLSISIQTKLSQRAPGLLYLWRSPPHLSHFTEKGGKSLILFKSILGSWINTYWTPTLRNYRDLYLLSYFSNIFMIEVRKSLHYI